MNPNTAPSRPPRSTFARWVSPGPDSSWTALRVTTAVWSVLAVVWVLYLVFGEAESYRLVLYPVLVLVAVLQVLSNVAAMRKKRAGNAGGAENPGGGGPGWYRG